MRFINADQGAFRMAADGRMQSQVPLRRRPARTLISAVSSLLLVVGLLVVVAPPAAAAAAACTGNEIVCENQLPGTPKSTWDIIGVGDTSIQGFATQMSVNRGNTIQFKVDTDARAYRIEIYRLGYYQGNGARKVADVTPSAALPQNQPACATDAATEIYDCGTWAVSASWAVPATAVSGVYIARLIRTDDGGDSHIPFIVRNDASTSQVVFQTSDSTWQAYNTYGGSSFYQGLENGRAYKLSYNRPFATRAGVTQRDFLFSNEYPMIRFLESNGYDISYISSLDTDQNGANLLKHKTFLSVGHDEYWSQNQRTNVENARDAGVNLAFFSGNEVYWKTRWEASEDGSNTPNRTLVCYKDTWANTQIDPVAATSTWRDPRFGVAKPENSLTGTFFTANEIDLPVTVNSDEGKLRLWRNTGLASQAAGSSTALAQHTVGYEADEDVDNGFRPAGLIRMSTATGTSPALIQGFGNLQTAAGPFTHHLTQYRAASGALVFGAGTVQWAWGLDTNHDGTVSPVDTRMQQATVNILADMSAVATTLNAGLVPAAKSTDTQAPTAVITSPAAGAPIAQGTVVSVTGTATDAGGGRVAGVEVTLDGGATWHPAQGAANFSYTGPVAGPGSGMIKARAIDDSANIQPTPTTLSLDSACPCSIFGNVTPTTPEGSDSSAVTLGVKFTSATAGFITAIRFYKAAGNTGTHLGALYKADGTQLATVTFSNESASGWQTAIFSQAVPIAANATYVAAYTAPNGNYSADKSYFDYLGQDGGQLSALGGWSNPNGVYTTTSGMPSSSFNQTNYYVDVLFSSSNSTPLSVYSISPINGATSVPASTPISATFNRDPQPGSISFVVKDSANAVVPGSVNYVSTQLTATFAPSTPLEAGATYSVAVTASADGVGPMTTPATWTFTTAQPDGPPGSCPCTLFNDSLVPQNTATDDPLSVELGVAFSSDVTGQITGVRFYKAAGNNGPHTISLWDGNGTQLATAAVTNESALGWQTANFAAPVSVTAGAAYTASYRAPVGRYSFTPNGLLQPVAKTPLRTAANAGRYTYGSGAPQGVSSSNYFVDPVFTVAAAAAPAIASMNPPDQSTSVSVGTSINVTFSTTVQQGSVSIVLKDEADATVAGTMASLPLGPDARFTPAASLAAGKTYTVVISGAKNLGGTPMATPVTTTFTTTGPQACPCWLLPSLATPAVSDSGDSGPVSLGLRFSASQDGYLSGIRFYRDAANTGSHVGTIYSATGDVLASVNYTAAAAGWQYASFSTPLAITAGTTYVASTFMPAGHYSYTSNFFSSPVVNDPLTGTAGVYTYGSEPRFPTSTYENGNYFVDVSFTPASAPAAPTGVTAVGDDGSATVSWTAPFNGGKPITSYMVTPYVGSTAQAPTVVSGSSPATTAIVGGLVNNTSYTFRVTATNSVGTSAPSAESNTITASPLPSAPTEVTAMAGDGSVTVSWTTPLSDGGHPIVSYTVTPFIGTTAQAPKTVTGGPATSSTVVTGLTAGTSYTFKVAATSSTGSGPAATSTAVSVCPCSLLGQSVVPPISDSGDDGPITVGLRFTPAVDGSILGLRYYRNAANTGLHTGSLYSANGAELATLTYSNGGPGWQVASFSSPVAVTAGTTYVASTFMPVGRYSIANNFFATPLVNSPLTGTLGVYGYGNNQFPTSSWSNSHYFVDVTFSTRPADSAPAVPAAPTGVSAAPGNAAATVKWTAPSDGGTPITGYTVTPYVGAQAQSPVSVGPAAVTATVPGLTNGTAYTFTVAATNAIGTGAPSAATAPVTPATVPGVPTAVTATGGNASATVSWTAPASNGGSAITGYSVTPFIGAQAQTAVVTAGTGTTATVNGLVNGTSYTFRVAAVSQAGTGAASAASSAVTPAAPVSPPAAPTGVTATAGNASATVSWTAPADGGSPITGYTVTPYIGSAAQATVQATGTQAVVNGLTNGTEYTFRVSATNAAGTGAASAGTAPVTPAAVPGAPTGVSATAGNGAATVTWTAPGNGGAGIASYTITPYIGTTAQPATTITGTPPVATANITGLANGTAYTFTVTAANRVGSGAASAASAAVTPVTVPGAPTAVTAAAGNTSATVTWTAPANGGSAITTYTVTPYAGTTAQTPRTVTGNPPATTLNVTGLTNGTAYTFVVTATSAVGTGAASTPSEAVTPAPPTAPAAPTGVAATAGNTSATVTWTAPGNGGSAITGYRVTPYVGTTAQTARVVNTPVTTFTVTGLTNGTAYTFRVAAVNAIGTGALSTASTAVTPATTPGTPTNVSASAGNTVATVTWSAPNNGGSGITSYSVTPFIGTTAQTALTITGTPPATTTNVTGLTNGTAYTFRVTAINAIGSGTQSNASAAVTPRGAPGAPTAVAGIAGDRAAFVSWAAPASNGGSAITNYTVTRYVNGASQGTTTAGAATSLTVSGLTNGTTYTFAVTATNAGGTSSLSPQSAGVRPLAMFVQGLGARATTVTTITATPASPITAGNRLVVMVGVKGTTTTTALSVTDAAGNSYAKVAQFRGSGSDATTEMTVWTAPITAGGGSRPLITAQSNASATMAVTVAEYAGLSTAAGLAAVDQARTASGSASFNGTAQSGATGATTAPGELAIGFYLDGGPSRSISAGSGYTARVTGAGNASMEYYLQDQTIWAAGTTANAQFGISSSTTMPWLAATVVFKRQ